MTTDKGRFVGSMRILHRIEGMQIVASLAINVAIGVMVCALTIMYAAGFVTPDGAYFAIFAILTLAIGGCVFVAVFWVLIRLAMWVAKLDAPVTVRHTVQSIPVNRSGLTVDRVVRLDGEILENDD